MANEYLTVRQAQYLIAKYASSAPTYSSDTVDNVSVSNASDKTLCDTGALTAGLYLIQGVCEFTTSSTTGRRVLFFSTSNTGSAVDRFARIAVPPTNGVATRVQLIYIAKITATTTFYLRAYQNSGNSMNVNAGISYIKFA